MSTTRPPRLRSRSTFAGTRTSGCTRACDEPSAPTAGRAHSGSTQPGQVPLGEARKADQREADVLGLDGCGDDVEEAAVSDVDEGGEGEEGEGEVPQVGQEGLRARGLIVR